MRRGAFAVALALASCAAPAPPPEERTITPEMLKPLPEAYRDYATTLIKLESTQPRERAEALGRLQAGPYTYFPDDRKLINAAAAGDDVARRELGRRGRLLDALTEFWGPVDPIKWTDARKRIVALGQDARIILVNTLLRMLLNGQLRQQWSSIRFQLIAVGEETLETAVALFKAKAEETPETIIYKRDDLVQITLVILGFGEKSRSTIEEFSRHPKFNVRRAIAVSLGEGKSVEHFAILETLLKRDTEWMVRADAANAIGLMRPVRAKAGTALISALGTERDHHVRPHIASALGTLVYEDAVPALVTSLDVPDYEYVEKAMFALCQITGERILTGHEWKRWYATDYAKWRAKLK